MCKKNIFGLYQEEIEETVLALGLPKYRGRQIAKWLYQKKISEFSLMTDITKKEHTILAENFAIDCAKEKLVLHSKDKKTSKYLLLLKDDIAVETVLMRQSYGNSICVSTQAGCSMGCAFCASAIGGLVRDLEAGEILQQVMHIARILESQNEIINNVVLMGTGEPLMNYDNVLKFIRLCCATYSFNMSFRNFRLSTSGLVPQIKKLALEKIPITLSISLHASNDSMRSKLMPVNKKYSLDKVLKAGEYYAKNTGRRVTYEYVLIANVNDQKEHAEELANLMLCRDVNINLIPINNIKEKGFLRPNAKQVQLFKKTLENKKINVTLRREMGSDILAACGQLRAKHLKEK